MQIHAECYRLYKVDAMRQFSFFRTFSFFFFFLFTRARLFCIHVHSSANTHTSPLDGFCIPKARLLAECRPTRDTIAFELDNYTSTHCFVVLPRRVSHLYFSRFLAIVYPSHARVRIIETSERRGFTNCAHDSARICTRV